MAHAIKTAVFAPNSSDRNGARSESAAGALSFALDGAPRSFTSSSIVRKVCDLSGIMLTGGLILQVQAPEPLDALSGRHLGGVDVALMVDRDVVGRGELAGLAANPAEPSEHFLAGMVYDPHFAVRAVDHVDVFLRLVRREHEFVDRAGGTGVLLVEMLGDERAVLAEDLHAVVGAVAGVNEAVLVDANTVHRVAELGGGRLRRVVGRRLLVARLLAVGAPVPLVGAGLGIEHHDPAIGIAVGGKDLLGGDIDRDIRRRAEPLGGIAVMALAGFADLHHELAVHGEFEELAILVAAAGEPDEVVAVDIDAVLDFRPLVALARAAPALHQVAGLVEHQDRRSGGTALGHGRVLLGGALARSERVRPLDHPDAIEPVHRDARDLPEDPVIRKRLRPQRVDLELGQATSPGSLCKGQYRGDDTHGRHQQFRSAFHRFLPFLICGAIRRSPRTPFTPERKYYAGHRSAFGHPCYTI